MLVNRNIYIFTMTRFNFLLMYLDLVVNKVHTSFLLIKPTHNIADAIAEGTSDVLLFLKIRFT